MARASMAASARNYLRTMCAAHKLITRAPMAVHSGQKLKTITPIIKL